MIPTIPYMILSKSAVAMTMVATEKLYRAVKDGNTIKVCHPDHMFLSEYYDIPSGDDLIVTLKVASCAKVRLFTCPSAMIVGNVDMVEIRNEDRAEMEKTITMLRVRIIRFHNDGQACTLVDMLHSPEMAPSFIPLIEIIRVSHETCDCCGEEFKEES